MTVDFYRLPSDKPENQESLIEDLVNKAREVAIVFPKRCGDDDKSLVTSKPSGCFKKLMSKISISEMLGYYPGKEKTFVYLEELVISLSIIAKTPPRCKFLF